MIVITDPAGRSVSMRGDWEGMTPGDLIVDATTGLPGSVQVRGELVDRLGSGVWTPAVWRAGREITISCWAHFAGLERGQRRVSVAGLARALLGLWADGSGLGELRYRHAGEDLSCAVQPLPGASWDVDTTLDYRGWLRAVVKLVSPDPCLYGPAQSVRVSTPAADYGLDWPLFTNGDVLTWGSGADLTVSGWIVNAGNAAAWPVVTVYGDFPSGVSVGDGSGQTVTFAGVVTPQAPLVLDFAAHTATVGGEDRSHMLTGRGFFQVSPGGVLRPVLRAAGVGSGYADVQVRSTYM